MIVSTERVLLRIFLSERHRVAGKPLWQVILARLQEEGCAGATVLHGLAGFGAGHVVHQDSLLHLTSEAPVIVECVEEEAKVRALLPWLREVLPGGLVTLERAQVLLDHARSPE